MRPAEALAGGRPQAASAVAARGRGLAATASILLCAAAFATLAAPRAIVACIAAVALVVVAVEDIDHGQVPNLVIVPALALVLLAQIALFGDQAAEWLLAPIVVAGVLMLPLLVGRSWLGMGDIKVVLLLGVALGWGVVGAIFLACLAAAPYTLSLVVRQGRGALKRRVAFAPFLALGGLAVLFAPHLASLATG